MTNPPKPERPQPYRCTKCDQRFPSWPKAETHAETHPGGARIEIDWTFPTDWYRR